MNAQKAVSDCLLLVHILPGNLQVGCGLVVTPTETVVDSGFSNILA
jgi:hypothetical protein